MKGARYSRLCAVGLVLLGVRPSVGLEAPLPGETVPRRRLVLLIASQLAGRFGADAHAQGGLAALHTYAQTRRTTLRPESGAVLLLHTGDFTGAADAETARNLLYPEGLDLVRYLGLEAALLTGREREVLRQVLRPQTGMPFVEFRPVAPEAKPFDRVPFPFRVVSQSGFAVWISGLSTGQVDARELRRELWRNRAADARVLLLGEPPKDPTPADLRRIGSITNPFDLLPRARRAVDIMAFPDSRDEVRRGSDGSLYCRVRARSVCEVELIYRREHLIGIRTVIFMPNAATSPLGRLRPDPILTRTFPAPVAK